MDKDLGWEKKKAQSDDWALVCGAPEEIRTPDPLVRSQVLYPAELPAHLKVSNCTHFFTPMVGGNTHNLADRE
jgi:hypothetical protein